MTVADSAFQSASAAPSMAPSDELGTEVDEQLVAARGDAVAQRLDRVGGTDLVGTHLGTQRGQGPGRVGRRVGQVGRTLGALGSGGRSGSGLGFGRLAPVPAASAGASATSSGSSSGIGVSVAKTTAASREEFTIFGATPSYDGSLVVCAARFAIVGALATPTSTNCSMPRPPCSGEPNSRSWVSIQRTGLANCHASSSISRARPRRAGSASQVAQSSSAGLRSGQSTYSATSST